MVKLALRAVIAVVVLALLGLFGYFYVTDHSGKPSAERAKGAAAQVGGVMVDQGIAELVRVRLVAKYGFDATRFLHVWHDNGHVLVYGLAPADVKADEVRDDVGRMPGVSAADVSLQPLPAYLTAAAPPPIQGSKTAK
jgi:hypothetical protein